MSRKVFFSFHYQDVIDFRANTVRNHWVIKEKKSDAGYFDKSIWEEAKKTSPIALKNLINNALVGTSVTCVLIGTNTYQRPWVRYEIFRSIYKGNDCLGVNINSIVGKDSQVKPVGKNPFNYTGIHFNSDGSKYSFVTRESIRENWSYWEEIESKREHDNDYFDKEYAKINAGKFIPLIEFFSTYDWVKDDGYNKFSEWIG
ncbi:TIR domain-containing protein [Pectobacterium brasiliense]|uniref:TIR domain-containing protein n=1 Tax=Pectobacterium brasiliense TaxID=180957 RepID=UPI001968C0AD|nr:TIR domain-containing protein [Pectobacterium brasiliense]MBN3174794.1 TIR domain-containing protein [Pectobacterium brasiliense]